jgi:hypothetical protein
LQIHFEYAFKPKGIISRLIVRFHENIVSRDGEQIVWKKGVLLEYKNSLARVIESERSRKITITVSGESSFENRELITSIRTEIKQIHRDWFEDRLKFEEKIPCYCEVCEKEPQFYELEKVKNYYEMNMEILCDKSVAARRPQQVNPRRLIEGVYIVEVKSEASDFMKKDGVVINGNINITKIIGDENTFVQDVKDSQITIQRQAVDEVSRKMNDAQKQTMEKLAGEVISRIEEELSKPGKANDELNEIKKGKWETKLKFALPFVPLEISRTIAPDEFISKVRKWLYGGDLQLNILDAEEEAKGFLNE